MTKEREAIDMSVGLNKRLRTYTADEIKAVVKNEYEQWIIRVPLLTFEMRRGPKGGVQDGFYDKEDNLDYHTRVRVSDMAGQLHAKQMAGFRLKYTPERLRELAYLRPLHPPQMEVTESALASYEFCLFTDKEQEEVIKFMIEQGAGDKLEQIFEIDILKWSKSEESDRVTYFADEQKRLMGRRSVKTVASYFKMYLPKDVPDHEIREFHSKLTDMHHKNDRFEVRVAKNAEEIIDIYQNTNFTSCMKVGGEYVDEELGTHPVEVYDSPDIDVLGLWDKLRGQFVARCVTNANSKQFNVIYPNDGSGSRKSAADRLKRWLGNNGYSHNYYYMNGCHFNVIRMDDRDGYIMPYIDGSSPFAVIADNHSQGIFVDDGDRHALTRDWKGDSSRYGAQPTRGWISDDDTY